MHNFPSLFLKMVLSFALLFGVKYPLLAQNNNIDSLTVALQKEKIEKKKIPILRQLSKAYTSVDPDRKYFYANQMRQIAEKHHIDSIIPVAYMDMAMTHGIKTQYDSSMYYFTKGLVLAKKYKTPKQEARAYVGIGYTFDRLDNPKAAIENYERALKIFQRVKSQDGLNQTNINLGSLYFDMDEFKIAEFYFRQVLESFKKMNDQSGIAYGYFIMGNASRVLNKDTEAYDYYRKSLEIRERAGDLNGIALANYGLGQLYLKQKKYNEAEKALHIAIEKNRILNNKYQEVAALITLSKVFVASKEYNEAEDTAKLAYQMGKQIKSKGLALNALDILVAIQEETADFKQAFEYQSQAIILNDSLDLQKIKNEFIFADFNRIQKENSVLEKSNEVIAMRNLTYKRALYIISSLFVMVLLLLILYLMKIRQKNKINAMLELQSKEISTINKTLENVNEELRVQNDLTIRQNAELERINSVKNKFFSIVSHDLRSPIATLKMLFSTYFDGHLTHEEMNVLLKKLEENIFNTADLLDNLLEWSKSQLEGMIVKPEIVPLDRIVSRNLKILNAQILEKKLQIENNISEKDTAFADRNMINVVIRNIISNSIKFCNEGDAIRISSEIKGYSILISVQDTGIGIEEEDHEKIFQLEHSITKGTSGEKGHHIGLVLCKDMVEQNKGRIWFESKVGVGTTFFIELPLHLIN
jgi:signal transduction histidine kinase